MQKINEITGKIIYLAYLALAIITPLLFTTSTTEIYEVPKMFFVYAISLVIFFALLYKFIFSLKISFPKSWPFYAILIFTLSQAASTITSTDKYLSLFGYPTRLNGGLLSTFSYLIIFSAALLTLTGERVKNLILAVIFTATAVALWGIPSHFGWDPSCFLLTGNLNSSCWSKDFDPALRIFSTLGQPNWLASYLILTLPIAFIYAIKSKGKTGLVFTASSVAIYWAIILTNSRAGLIALAFSLVLSAIFLGINNIKSNLAKFIILLFIYGVITVTFADFIAQRLPQLTTPAPDTATQAQIENVTQQTLGTESGKIRLIVWQGAIEIWKHWPVLGPGPETFVNTYFTYRPIKHNQTSEWEYFYNKAHNEFLNYLSTSGIVGLAAYLFFLLTVFSYILKFNKSRNSASTKAVIAGAAGYLVTIFFGFTTVATQTTFVILVSSALILTGNPSTKEINLKFLKNNVYKMTALVATTVIFTFSAVTFMRTFVVNIIEKSAERSSSPNAVLKLKNAIVTTQFGNPYILADFAYETAAYSQTLKDPKNAQKLTREAVSSAQYAQKISPNNYLVTQKAAKAFLLLSENSNLENEIRQISQKLTQLAPNYPPAYLLKAQLLIALNDKQEALDAVNKTLKLKPEYLDAQKLRDELEASH